MTWPTIRMKYNYNSLNSLLRPTTEEKRTEENRREQKRTEENSRTEENRTAQHLLIF